MTSKEFNSLNVGDCITGSGQKYIIVSKEKDGFNVKHISTKSKVYVWAHSYWTKYNLTPLEKVKLL